jgi:protease I
MSKFLSGSKIAILAANGFSQHDFTETQKLLTAAGASLKVISPDQGLVNGWEGSGWGHHFAVDQALSTALGADFDMLVVPGGLRSMDKLKTTAHTRRFLNSFMAANKPVVLFPEAETLLEFTGHTLDAQNIYKAPGEEFGAGLVDFFASYATLFKQAA